MFIIVPVFGRGRVQLAAVAERCWAGLRCMSQCEHSDFFVYEPAHWGSSETLWVGWGCASATLQHCRRHLPWEVIKRISRRQKSAFDKSELFFWVKKKKTTKTQLPPSSMETDKCGQMPDSIITFSFTMKMPSKVLKALWGHKMGQ